jgi:four helix bundle protein
MASGFEELEIWKKAHSLTLLIYKIVSKRPSSETYGLISQIKRSAVSVELNIAEGQARYHYKETMHFLYDSRASISEVRNCLILARDLPEIEISEIDFNFLYNEYVNLSKGINGFLNYLKKRTN